MLTLIIGASVMIIRWLSNPETCKYIKWKKSWIEAYPWISWKSRVYQSNPDIWTLSIVDEIYNNYKKKAVFWRCCKELQNKCAFKELRPIFVILYNQVTQPWKLHTEFGICTLDDWRLSKWSRYSKELLKSGVIPYRHIFCNI